MAPLPVHSPDVRYRIQNVDLNTYLERRSQIDVATLRRRDNLGQQWFFESIPNGLFKIINADDNKTYMLEASSTGTSITPKVQQPPPGVPITPQLEWDLVKSGLGSFYIVNNSNVFLHLDNNNDSTPKLTLDPNYPPPAGTTFSKEPNYRWFLVEDSPTSLPDDGTGTYVIQSLKGDAIQSASAPGIPAKLSIKVSSLGDEHKWEIVERGNGKATIRNTLVDEFINVQQVGAPAVWTPVLSKTTSGAHWDIKKVGNSFSITIAPQINAPQTRLALTVLNDVIVLKTNMDVPNQQWSIVPTDLTSFKPLITINPATSLPVGEYALLSGLGFYAWVDSAGKVQASLSDPGFHFKFDLAGGNDGTGLGNVYVSHSSSASVGFLYATDRGPDVPFRSTYLDSTGIIQKDIWRIQLIVNSPYVAIPQAYSITHIGMSRRLVCFYTNDSHDQGQIGLEIPNDRNSNPYWYLIPK